jgi:hypothetical protein
VKSSYVTDLRDLYATNLKGLKFSTSENESDASVLIFYILSIYAKKSNKQIYRYVCLYQEEEEGEEEEEKKKIKANDSSSGATRSELKRMCVILLLDASSLNSLGNRSRGEQQ